MLQYDANVWPPKYKVRRFHRRILRFRQWLIRDIRIKDGQYDYRFRCETVREFNRCLKIFSKEPGTVDWIKQNVKSGDIFCDIGANIGVYSVLAASRTGKEGRVYAFEPHGANFARLIDNIALNNFQQVVFPNNFALNDKKGLFPFHYKSGTAGTSDSQLSSLRDETNREESSQITELKYATTLDHLIDSGDIKSPQHIKIDVDGNEFLILAGMDHLLSGAQRPVSVQVEMNDPHKDRILEFMKDHGYQLIHKHFTRSAQRKINESMDSEKLGYNAVFRFEE